MKCVKNPTEIEESFYKKYRNPNNIIILVRSSQIECTETTASSSKVNKYFSN